ncbi:PilZ domain-containing protein [Anderseniella sp. Alg231-50]|uniref:PilZ domain-containing protein n=1 Tax=Anderseniella sp. Alg231-50 TaxID=1922226 RepID=UPI000D55DE3F
MPKQANANFQFQERRRSPRRNVKIGANAVIANPEATIDCTILDFSESGAKLQMEDVDIITARFKLFIPDVDHIYECEVVWRDGKYLGVKFANSMP